VCIAFIRTLVQQWGNYWLINIHRHNVLKSEFACVWMLMSKAKYPTSTKYPITTPALISMCVLCVNVVRWYNYVSSDEVQSRIGLSLLYCTQMKAWIIWSRCQTAWWCLSNPNPTEVLRGGVLPSSDWKCPRFIDWVVFNVPANTKCPRGQPSNNWIHQIYGNKGIPLVTLQLAVNRSFRWQILTAGCYSWTLHVMNDC